MSEGAGGPFRFGRVLSGWGWLIARDYRRITPVILTWIIAGFVLHQVDTALGLPPGAEWLSTTLLADPLFGGLLYVIALSDEDASPGAAFDVAINRYLALLLLTILSTLGIVAGFFMLLLPGIALAVLWSVAFPILMAEDANPIEALGASFSRVKSQFWPVLGLLAIYTFGIIILAAVMGLMGSVDPFNPSPTEQLAEAIVTAVTASAGVYLNVAIYRELSHTAGHDVSVFD